MDQCTFHQPKPSKRVAFDVTGDLDPSVGELYAVVQGESTTCHALSPSDTASWAPPQVVIIPKESCSIQCRTLL